MKRPMVYELIPLMFGASSLSIKSSEGALREGDMPKVEAPWALLANVGEVSEAPAFVAFNPFI